MKSRTLISIILLSAPALVWGYVDPGILGALYQMGYIAIFGILTLFIFRPWGYLKAKIRKLRGLEPPDGEDAPSSGEPSSVSIRKNSDAPG